MESNEITSAVIATINNLLKGGDVTTRTLNEIQKALAEVNEHFEQLSDKQNPFLRDL